MTTIQQSKQFNFRVNADLLEKAKAIAAARGNSISDVLNNALERYVASDGLSRQPEQFRFASQKEVLNHMEIIFDQYDEAFRELVNR